MSKRIDLKDIVIGLIMTSASVWAITRNFFFGWAGAFFFVSATVLIVVKYLKPDFKWVKSIEPNKKEFNEQTEKEFKEIFNENGIFTFSDNGFSVKTTNAVHQIEWTEINSMLGYKEDHYATDCICLDVFCDNDKSFKITEDTLGWFRFLEHSKIALPKIYKYWEIEIATPVFETKLTLVFDRQDRLLKDVIAEHYKS